nr:leucine-rich repeat domain-containing protein [Lachnospiraceae bacterium]
MGKIGVEHLCKGCMSFLQYTDRPCPKCGFDEKWFYSGKEYLKVASVLNDRYLVGKVLEQNDYELVYIGWDLEANTKVTIRECFLKDTVKRDSSISNDVIVNDESRSAYFETIKENYVEDSMKLAKLGNLFGIVWTYDAIWCNNTAYVITEYIEYVTLDEFIEQRGGRMSVYEVLSYLQPVVYSLRTIHEQGIYHGNINLKSVVINANNDVVLIGFGLNSKLSETITYKDDIQGICKIIYKIICGPRYLNNLTCYKETGKLMMPNTVKDYVVSALNKGLAANGETLYCDVVELYNDIYENGEYNIDLQTVGFISNFAANRPVNSMNAYNAENAQIGIQNMQYVQYNQNAVTPYYNGAYPAAAVDGNRYITINDTQTQAYKRRNTIIIAVTAIMTIFVLAICVFVIIPGSKKGNGIDSSTNSQAGSGEQHLPGAIQWKEPQIELFVRTELDKQGNEEITESDVKSIKTVTLRTKDIKTVDDLKYFTSLDTLILNNNSKLEDISGLENLTELTELNLSNCKITDITPLKKLSKLRILDLSGNSSLSDITVLNNLTELTTLNINNCKLEDVSVLKDVKSLRTLGLAG